jgi:hypothetical protein
VLVVLVVDPVPAPASTPDKASWPDPQPKPPPSKNRSENARIKNGWGFSIVTLPHAAPCIFLR